LRLTMNHKHPSIAANSNRKDKISNRIQASIWPRHSLQSIDSQLHHSCPCSSPRMHLYVLGCIICES
jgi:hypothetical protein